MTPEAKANATNRIKQLLRKNNEQSLQLAYMQLVTAQLMVLIPKNAVSNILDAAAKKIHNQTKGY